MSDEPAAGVCAWCGATAATGLTHCGACGAALAQRETIGDLIVPGVTHVDPELSAYAAQPLRIPGASPTQVAASGLIGAVAAGGVPGLAAIGAIAAVAAEEYLGAGQRFGRNEAPLEHLGQPSEAVLDMVRRLDSAAGSAGVATGETMMETIQRLDDKFRPAASPQGNETDPPFETPSPG